MTDEVECAELTSIQPEVYWLYMDLIWIWCDLSVNWDPYKVLIRSL
jgi:hypothetical protein